MAKVVLSGVLTVPEARWEETNIALVEHTRLTKAETGCLVFEVTQRAADPTQFEVYEEFADAASFRVHQTRAKASAWGSLTSGFKRDYQIQGYED